MQHLPAPAPVVPLASPPVTGEGQWSPAGRLVDGVPAVYETMLRPSAIHTSYVVGVAWMDTNLLKSTLYSGSQIPGGGPYSHTAPVSPSDATSLVAAFNAGFLMCDAKGGYYTDGKTIFPLRTGAASFVVYKNGNSTVGQWGRDVTMAPDVVSVRQNLDLLVDGGQVVPAAYTADPTQWGRTLGGGDYVWRSGLGVTANGALVYVGGPGLDIADLATILVRAGAVRAMELDINTDWVNFSTYHPSTAAGAASAANGTGAAVRHDRDSRSLLRALVGPRLHHHVRPLHRDDRYAPVTSPERPVGRLEPTSVPARAAMPTPTPGVGARATVRALARGMRPRQWIKNLLVFMAPAAAGVLGDPRTAAAHRRRVRRVLLGGLGHLSRERRGRRGVGPAPPGEAPPAGGQR